MGFFTTTIDAYCERTHDGFWAEPLNAWTNLAFLVSAAVAFVAVRRVVASSRLPKAARGEGGALGGSASGWTEGSGSRPLAAPSRLTPPFWDLWLLPVWLVCIAVGSFLFHTWATPFAALLDVGSIAGFIITFLAVFASRVLGWQGVWVSAWLIGLLAASVLLPMFVCPSYVCGYAPTLASVFIAGLLARDRGRPMGARLLWAAGGVFILSLAVTGFDGPLCPWWPFGTHFVWHLLNAVVLSLAMVGLGRSLRREAAAST
jgi:hypothetical protein